MEDRTTVDELFSRANEIVSALPTTKDKNSFYNLANVSSQQKRKKWEDGAEQLLKLAEVAPDEKKFYFLFWARDVLTGLGELERALHTKPRPR